MFSITAQIKSLNTIFTGASRGTSWTTSQAELVSVAHITTEGCGEVWSLCSSLKPCWCSWAMLLLEVVVEVGLGVGEGEEGAY